jgi:hypothetical protein
VIARTTDEVADLTEKCNFEIVLHLQPLIPSECPRVPCSTGKRKGMPMTLYPGFRMTTTAPDVDEGRRLNSAVCGGSGASTCSRSTTQHSCHRCPDPNARFPQMHSTKSSSILISFALIAVGLDLASLDRTCHCEEEHQYGSQSPGRVNVLIMSEF